MDDLWDLGDDEEEEEGGQWTRAGTTGQVLLQHEAERFEISAPEKISDVVGVLVHAILLQSRRLFCPDWLAAVRFMYDVSSPIGHIVSMLTLSGLVSSLSTHLVSCWDVHDSSHLISPIFLISLLLLLLLLLLILRLLALGMRLLLLLLLLLALLLQLVNRGLRAVGDELRFGAVVDAGPLY